MGHLIFIILHILALLFGAVALFVTVPMHMIYTVVKQRSGATPTSQPEAPDDRTHHRCPECRELIRKDASKCKHCGCTLIPQTIEPPARANANMDGNTIFILVAIIVVLLVLTNLIK